MAERREENNDTEKSNVTDDNSNFRQTSGKSIDNSRITSGKQGGVSDETRKTEMEQSSHISPKRPNSNDIDDNNLISKGRADAENRPGENIRQTEAPKESEINNSKVTSKKMNPNPRSNGKISG